MKLLLSALSLLSSLSLLSGPTGDLTVTRFKYKGDGFMVHGDKGVSRGNTITVTRARIIIEGKEIALITSPKVDIDVKRKRISGRGKVKVRTRTVIMNGEGFDADIERGRLSIYRSVEIKFLQKFSRIYE